MAEPNGATDGGWPLVSVVIPAYNAARHIGEAIDSVLAQDYPAIEVIAVDDGSTDATVSVLAAYGDRISVVTQSNAGSATARNEGIAAATGEYIAFLDADDVWLPGKLTNQIAYLEEHPEIGLCCSLWRVWEADTSGVFPAAETFRDPAVGKAPVAVVPERSGWIYHRLLLDVIVWTSTVVMRRDLAARVGAFDGRFRRGQDYDFWLRASRLTPIATLDRPLALYRQHPENSTRSCPNRNYPIEIIDQALARWGPSGPDGSRPAPAALRARRARLWMGFGYKQLHAGNAGRALRSYITALAIRPYAVRNWTVLGRGMGVAFLAFLKSSARGGHESWSARKAAVPQPSLSVLRLGGERDDAGSEAAGWFAPATRAFAQPPIQRAEVANVESGWVASVKMGEDHDTGTNPAVGSFENGWRDRFQRRAQEFDDDAGIAGWSRTGLDSRFKRFRGLWRRPAAGTWLDVGCGAGTYTRFLADEGLEVIGFDYSLPSLDRACTRSPQSIGWCSADVRHLPVPQATANGVLCFGVMQALQDPKPALDELMASLAPGGTLWVDGLNRYCLPTLCKSLWGRLRGHPARLRYDTPGELRRHLERAGAVEVLRYWLPLAPARFGFLRMLFEHRWVLALFQGLPWLGFLFSHSFILVARRAERAEA